MEGRGCRKADEGEGEGESLGREDGQKNEEAHLPPGPPPPNGSYAAPPPLTAPIGGDISGGIPSCSFPPPILGNGRFSSGGVENILSRGSYIFCVVWFVLVD